MEQIILVIHILLGIAIIGLVLVQRGKGAQAGAAFGAGASGTVFGARGSASFLSRATAVAAALFFVTSLTYAYLVQEPAVITEPSVEVPEDIGDAPIGAATDIDNQLGDAPAAEVAPAVTDVESESASEPASAPASSPASEQAPDDEAAADSDATDSVE